MNKNGYLIINFYKKGAQKGFAVHRLIAITFIPNDDKNKTQVNHIDGNKQNNCIENLEWVTPYENIRHSIEKLKKDHIGGKNHRAKSIEGYYKGKKKYSFNSLADAGRYFSQFHGTPKGCKESIWKALNGKLKTYHNCIWKYT